MSLVLDKSVVGSSLDLRVLIGDFVVRLSPHEIGHLHPLVTKPDGQARCLRGAVCFDKSSKDLLTLVHFSRTVLVNEYGQEDVSSG